MTALAPTLQAFFTERLVRERAASTHTIAAYRDTMRLLLAFANQQTGTAPVRLDISQLDAPLITAFLDHLETNRHNSVRTRNARLAAIHSLFTFAALRHPEHAADIQRILAIGPKRHQRAIISFLAEPEITALLAAPDRTTWIGRRDAALLTVAIVTGLRASELTGLTCGDVHLGAGAHLCCHGKGRKDRITPLTGPLIAAMQHWIRERTGMTADPLFPTRLGHRMSTDALARLLAKATTIAAEDCPSLADKKVTPHTLRHTAAMRLLRAGVDITVIALWLGHESTDTTRIYLTADLELKQHALDKTRPIGSKPGRFKPPDRLLAFLEAL